MTANQKPFSNFWADKSSVAQKLQLFWPCLREKYSPRRNLLAGPYAGEFGYELMQWQGFVRARRHVYEQVHVLTYPGREYLYEGCQVHYHEIDLKQAGYAYGRISPGDAHRMAATKAAEIGLRDFDIFDTSLLCTQYHKNFFWRQEFRLFSEPPLSQRHYDVVFHFRQLQKEGPDHQKNYSAASADRLVQMCQTEGLSVACIGHPLYAYCPPGCLDHRSVELRQTVAAISTARMVAGENSGPMHLANLCGRPTTIWAQDQWRIDYSLRWNPFQVPIYVASNSTCQPDPGAVCQAILASLKDLQDRTGNFDQPCFTLPARPIPNI